jgi:hypothetical protein
MYFRKIYLWSLNLQEDFTWKVVMEEENSSKLEVRKTVARKITVFWYMTP